MAGETRIAHHRLYYGIGFVNLTCNQLAPLSPERICSPDAAGRVAAYGMMNRRMWIAMRMPHQDGFRHLMRALLILAAFVLEQASSESHARWQNDKPSEDQGDV